MALSHLFFDFFMRSESLLEREGIMGEPAVKDEPRCGAKHP